MTRRDFLDFGTEFLQTVGGVFVTSFDDFDVVYFGLAAGGQSGNEQRHAGSDVWRGEVAAVERGRT